MQYTESFISNIIEQNDIAKIVSEYVELKPKGKNLFGLCPFHKSKVPTFSVNASKKMFFCFACREGGNVIQFIMKIKNIKFKEAIEYLASKKEAHEQIAEESKTGQIKANDDITAIDKNKLKKDKFFVNIENSEHLINIYTHIILFFEQNYSEASISYTKNYVGIKLDVGLNRCWFTTSGTKNFEFKFRKDINKQDLKDNMISYKVDSKKAFDTLIPLINQKMTEEQQTTTESTPKIKKGITLRFNDILMDESDIVKIFSTGSCNPETRLGKYHALLEYKAQYKTVSEDLTDTTVNRCIIIGLIEAVRLLKKPCKAYIVTSTPIGVATTIKSGKGTNSDIVKELIELLKEKGCEAEFIAVEGEGDKLNTHIFSKIQRIEETADSKKKPEGKGEDTENNAMSAGRYEYKVDEDNYVWDGKRWFEKNTNLEPPVAILNKLNKLLSQEDINYSNWSEDDILEKAAALRDSYNYTMALRLVKIVFDRQCDNSKALTILSSILRKIGNPQKALDETKDFIKTVKSAALYTTRAAAYCDLEQWENAKKEVARALAIESSEEAFAVVNRIKAARPNLYIKYD